MLATASLFGCTTSCFWILIFSFIPSLLWLLLFWLQDKHPEPKRLVLQIFVWGMLISIPVIVLESSAYIFTLPFLKSLNLVWLYGFLGVAFVEETAKYLIVRTKALPLREFNEPQDAILYMVAVALGFAAVENFSFALAASGSGFSASLSALGMRALTSTLLHVISSGLVGAFLAVVYFPSFRATIARIPFPFLRHWLLACGLAIATLLHGFYNYFIIEDGPRIFEFIPFISLCILLGGGTILGIIYIRLRNAT